MSDHEPIEDRLGREDLEARCLASRNFAPKLPRSWKAGFALEENIAHAIEHIGVENCGLLTLLFANPDGRRPIAPTAAQEIFKKFARRLLPSLFKFYVAILDYHRSGAIHVHMLVALPFSVRDGWDFDADRKHRELQHQAKQEKRKLTAEERAQSRDLCHRMTTNKQLKGVIKTLQAELPKFGFGRSYPFELKPVRDPASLAHYIAGRYRESHARQDLRPEHSRCVRYSKGFPRCIDKGLRFSLAGPSAELYRRKKAAVGAAMGFHDIGEMISHYGPRWEYEFRDILQPVNPWDTRGFFADQWVQLQGLVSAYRPYSALAPAKAAQAPVAPIEWNAPVPPPMPIPDYEFK